MISIAQDKATQEIITIGREAYGKNLVSARAGNISIRLNEDCFLITGQGAPLGFLGPEILVVADLDGTKKSSASNLSFETGLHRAIYKNSNAGAIVHVHPPFTLTLMDSDHPLRHFTFEEAIFLGTVPVFPQEAPNVTDTVAVVSALALNNIVVLKNHGVVSVGETIWDAFFLAELLEETAQMNILSVLLKNGERKKKVALTAVQRKTKPVKLFSKEHLSHLQRAINRTQILQKLSPKTCFAIGMRQNDTGLVYMLVFRNGKVTEIKKGDEAGAFIISGTTTAWCSVFNGLMDPFTAIVQKKMGLAGRLREFLQGYRFLRPLFNVWQTIPVRE